MSNECKTFYLLFKTEFLTYMSVITFGSHNSKIPLPPCYGTSHNVYHANRLKYQ